jgi:DNA-binding transcriptional ArsR family regulator
MVKMKPAMPPLTHDAMEKIAGTFRALSEPQRLRILQVLEAGERPVGDIAAAVEGTQSNISRHLQALKQAGLLSRRRDGNSILYAIADPMVFQLFALVCHPALPASTSRK